MYNSMAVDLILALKLLILKATYNIYIVKHDLILLLYVYIRNKKKNESGNSLQ